MEAIILAGGLGTRLRPVVADLPKAMAPINGRPFLELLLHHMSQNGVRRAILALGFMADPIVKHFGKAFESVSLEYSFEDQPLGTGGAVRKAMSLCLSDHALVVNGDTYFDVAYSEVERIWFSCRKPIIVSRYVRDVYRYGQLHVVDGFVRAFAEKGGTGAGLISAGVYMLPRDAFAEYPSDQQFSLESDYFQCRVAELGVINFTASGAFIDIGTPGDYERSQTLLKCR